MNYNSLRLLAVCIFAFSLSSCDNEPLEGDFPTNTTNPTNPVAGPPTQPGEGSTGDYWPTALGNIWLFNTVFEDGTSSENDYEIIGQTFYDGILAYQLSDFITPSVEFNGFDDSLFESLDLELPEVENLSYLIKNEGNYAIYYEGFDFDFNGITSTLDPFGYVFFKDYLQEGESFTGSFDVVFTVAFDPEFFEDFGDGIEVPTEPMQTIVTLNYESTIVQRDVEVTVNGEVYQDVVIVNFESSYFDTELNQTVVGESEIYFAKDIGPIKIVVSSNDESDNYNSELSSYTLN